MKKLDADKTRGHILCGPQPRCRLGARRRPTGFDSAERPRQQAQSDGHRGGGETELPTHIRVDAADYGLSRDSVILLEQVRTLDKRRLREKMGHLDTTAMNEVDHALSVSFGLDIQ